jgi:hypothetical protein
LSVRFENQPRKNVLETNGKLDFITLTDGEVRAAASVVD